MPDPLHAARILQALPQLGPATFLQLLELFPSAGAVLEQPADKLAPCLKPATLNALRSWQQNPEAHPLTRQLAREDDWLAEHPDCHLIGLQDPRYPPLLKEIASPPLQLWLRGNPDCLHLPQLAIVGSRSPSVGGEENARQFARYLAEGGFAITSGLARGIDGCAHQGALAGGGRTLAILGTGVDRIYPAQHRKLAADILVSGGALVSEFPPHTRAEAHNFPRRNRIISGLSLGTLVVEAAVKSGSLITARLALEQNREVFAIPGSIHNPLARGCHRLIREGATLVETAADIFEQLQGSLAWQRQQLPEARSDLPPPLSPDLQSLLDAIGFDPVDIDQLVETRGMPVGELMAALIALQVEGLIADSASGYYRLRQD